MRRLAVAFTCALILGACSSSKSSTPTTAAAWWKGAAVTDMRGKATTGGEYPEVAVQVLDNSFTPDVLRIDPGVTVVWTNRGRSDHNIVKADNADFGKQFGVDH